MKRYIQNDIEKDLEKRMVLLSGPRQSGKTTLAKSILQEARAPGLYLNWDQVKDRQQIQKQTWERHIEFLCFDEIHKKKQWKTFLKGLYDTREKINKALKILVTGSARLEVFHKAGDSMFGRYHSWRLHPFCLAEDPLQLNAKAKLDRMLKNGPFPAPYLSNDITEVTRWRNQRWQLLLRDDVRDLESIKDLQSLELLAELLKTRAAGILNISNVAEDVEKSSKTIKSWLHVLEKLYLVFLVPPFSKNIKRAINKQAKLYFIDTGDLEEQDIGIKIENLVATNLLKRIHYIEDCYGEKIALHYLRDKDQREVDFVITIKNKPVALIEVKNSNKQTSSDLLFFKKMLGINHAYQIHADLSLKKYSSQGITHISITDFFSTQISDRYFWQQ